MDKNQTSRGAHASDLSTQNRQLYLARFFLLALFLVASVMSLQPMTSADQKLRGRHQLRASAPDCSQQCEQQYVQCLASGRDPVACDTQYNACIANCP